MENKVSVMVVTFNSEGTILDTLESIRGQSIGSNNIELIISDDCSSDSTLKVINEWLHFKGREFFRYKLLTKPVNLGVSSNCNAGWKECSCDWIKSIGGDDLLEKQCLENFLDFIKDNSNCSVVFSAMQWFGRINKITPEPFNMPFFSMDSYEQFSYLMFRSFNIAPTSFIKKDALKAIGYADEKFTLIEDLPLWLKFTSAGYKLYFLPKITVKYRVSDSTSKHSKRYVNIIFLEQLIQIDSNFKFNELKSISLKLAKIDTLTLLYGKLLISKLTNNKVNTLSKVLDVFHFISRPFYFYWKLRRYYVNFLYKHRKIGKG
ncbi:glycosyltransferase [Pantoea sp. GM01]|uniref:glycosyltransferase family 2 protein n=1 Tax=Pantoea sp. GM01 TaxID=1144320 RepID=UPI000271435C|nr:glycosyltransferase [Pantoea sp. GM01]EJL89600.1 putative glycosyltransferase [Pantoea sp. GM01]